MAAAKYLVSQTARRAYRSIGAALEVARGSRRPVRVEIGAGNYPESLTVSGDVELVAAGDVVINGGGGAAVEAWGNVQLTGLTLLGNGGETVRCRAGTLTVAGSHIHNRDGVSLHALTGTSATLRDSTVRGGRVLFTGSTGLVEQCRFADAANNAVAAIEGADVRIQECWFGGSRIHGVLARGSRVTVAGCELTGTGNASIASDGQAELIVTNCRITAVHDSGVSYAEQSRGLLEDTVVTDAEHGVAVVSGANPVVRRCVFTDCRDTGININSQGLGRFEDCEVTGAGNVAVFSTTGGSPDVEGCRVSGGNVGIAVLNGRGRFARCEIRDLTNVGLRLLENTTATFAGIRVVACPAGLEAKGTSKAELVESWFENFTRPAVAVLEQARITLRNCVARHGPAGYAAGGRAQLFLYDCRVDDTEAGGALAYGEAAFTSERLVVTQPGAYGLRGQDSAYLDVRSSEFADTRYVGISVADNCGGRLVGCVVTGTQGASVVENGRVQVIDLHSELPVTQQLPEPPANLPQQIVNIINGPFFNAPAYGVRLSDGDTPVQPPPIPVHAPRPTEGTAMSESESTARPPESGANVTHNYAGPFFNREVHNPVMAWGNNTVNQYQQQNNNTVAPGFEEVFRVVADVLARLAELGLPQSDAQDATEHGQAVLTEITNPTPDRGVVRRGLAALKGTLAQLATGLLSGANAGAVEVGKQMVQALTQLHF